MQDFMKLINMQLMLFCLMALGVLFAKMNVLTASVRAALSDMIISLFLPCSTVVAFMVSFEQELLQGMLLVMAVSVGIIILSLVLNQFLYNRFSHEEKSVLQYGTLVSNASFMGNPIVEGIYGPQAVIFATAYLLPLRIIMWSQGLAYFAPTTRKQTLKKLALNPCIIATVVGVVLLLTGWRPPTFAHRTLVILGNCTSGLSMLVVGGILAGVKPKNIFNKKTLFHGVVRLCLIPLVALGVLVLLPVDPQVAGVGVVLSGMPSGTTTSILAAKYGGDSELASGLVFVSTLFSMVTVPLLALLLGAVM